MNVVAIWTQTLNGRITRGDKDPRHWSVPADQTWFREAKASFDALVMGRKTFDDSGKPARGHTRIVMTRNTRDAEPVEREWKRVEIEQQSTVTIKPAARILSELEACGMNNVAIIGGKAIYSLFLKEERVDELWITVQPFLFADGIGAIEGIDAQLSLLDTKKLGDGVVLVKYRLMK